MMRFLLKRQVHDLAFYSPQHIDRLEAANHSP